MRIVALLLATALAGCHHANDARPAMPSTPPNPPAADDPCRAATATLVGQPLSDALTARARALAGRSVLRVIGPGDMVTRDYREDRLNISVDARRRVVAIACY